MKIFENIISPWKDGNYSKGQEEVQGERTGGECLQKGGKGNFCLRSYLPKSLQLSSSVSSATWLILTIFSSPSSSPLFSGVRLSSSVSRATWLILIFNLALFIVWRAFCRVSGWSPNSPRNVQCKNNVQLHDNDSACQKLSRRILVILMYI